MSHAKVVLVDLQPRSVTLQPTREPGFFEGSYSLLLSNARGVPFAARIEVRAAGEARAEWISIPSERTLFDFPADKTQPIPVNVRVPFTAAGKTMRFSITVMDKANPDELYDMQGAEFVVPAAPKPVEHGKLPRWLIPVIVGAVLLISGVSFAIYKVASKPGLGTKCDPEQPNCPQTIACHAAKKRCLASLGQTCEDDSQCVTQHCREGKCGPYLIGEACDPNEPLCAENLECSKTALKCLEAPRAPKPSDPFAGVWTGQDGETFTVTLNNGCVTWKGKNASGTLCDYCVGTYSLTGTDSAASTVTCKPKDPCSRSPVHTSAGTLHISSGKLTYAYSFGAGNSSFTGTRVSDAPADVCDSVHAALD